MTQKKWMIGLVAGLASLGSVEGAWAQPVRTVVGVVGGYAGNDADWTPASDNEEVGGLVLGAFADVGTSLGWLSVLAEGGYTRRGSDVLGGGASGDEVDGAVRADYLSFSLRPGAAIEFQRIRLRLSAGPTLEQLVRSRLTPGLDVVLDEPGGPAFGVTAGVGLGFITGLGRSVEVEARLFEGLSDAYTGDFRSVHFSAWEVVGRVGVPLARR